MNRSENIDLLATALAKFQASMTVLKKTGRNFAKGNAATIGDAVSVARHGAPFGLSYTQPVSHYRDEATGEKGAFVETIVMHSSGQFISSGQYPIEPAKKNDPASLGAAVTYARKNQLMSMYGIADHNDDDIDWDLIEDADGSVRMPDVSPDQQPLKPNKKTAAVPSRSADAPAGDLPTSGGASPITEKTLDQQIAEATSEQQLGDIYKSLGSATDDIVSKFKQRKQEILNQ